ncbi:MAG: hypothetical protein RBT49_00235 [Bacteroidales bacterium]|nr:hypothetical protein [Bacteroidales bacterium]
MNNNIILSFVNNLKRLYLCDFIENSVIDFPPVIINNENFLSDSLSGINPLDFTMRNINYLNTFLKEITIIVNNYDSDHNLNKIYFQASSMSNILNKPSQLVDRHLEKIYSIIRNSPIKCVNIVGSDIFNYSQIQDLFNFLNSIDVLKIINLNGSDLVKIINQGIENKWLYFFKELEKEYSILMIFLDKNIKEEDFNLIKGFQDQFKLNIEFKFIIEESDEIVKAEKLTKNLSDNYSFYAFYNGNNLSFIKREVFLSEDEIMNIMPMDSKEIFSRSKLNRNYFSKLTFMSNGNIYSNFHKPKVGDLDENKIYKIIYNELKNGYWVYTRKLAKPCKNCIYNTFCPPVSNYEFDLNRNNLCLLN